MLLLMMALQAAQAPDIEFQARVKAKSAVIERADNVSLIVRADPDGGSAVTVNKSRQPKGARTLRNVDVRIDARAVIAKPREATANINSEGETTQPQ